MRPEKRIDVTWSSNEVKIFEAFIEEAQKKKITPQELVKKLIEDLVNEQRNTSNHEPDEKSSEL